MAVTTGLLEILLYRVYSPASAQVYPPLVCSVNNKHVPVISFYQAGQN